MQTTLLILFIIYALMKLSEINNHLLMIKRKLDSLQYDVSGLILGENREPAIQEQIAEERPPIASIPLPREEEIPVRSTVPKRPKKEKSFTEDIKERFGSSSLEDFLVGNLLLKVSIVTFVLGVGFFLKYSIDQNWIPIWGRISIGIMIGLGMLWAGQRDMDNAHKLFSEGLFGGGIAILYLSIFAGYTVDGFAFLSFTVAFIAMMSTTILAGWISVRFDAMSTAVFGLVGGFATPFLIHTGSDNLSALMIYILFLNLGVLYISISKKWPLLNWLSFFFTAVIEMQVSRELASSFGFLLTMFVSIFLIYSIVPFIKEIREKKVSLDGSLLRLFGANIIIFLMASFSLFYTYDLNTKMTSIITIATALYLFSYAYYLKRAGGFTKNLYYVMIAIATGLLLLTPIILFEGNLLSATWAIEAVILYWVANKSKQSQMLWFSALAFLLSFMRYISENIDTVVNISMNHTYYHDLLTQTLSAVVVIGAFLLPYKLPKQRLNGYDLQMILNVSGVFLLFVFLNVQVYNWALNTLPRAQDIATTLLWVLFGIGLFVVSLVKDKELGKQISIGLIIIAVIKAFFHDLAGADPLYRIILFIVVGMLLFVLAYFYKRKKNQEPK